VCLPIGTCKLRRQKPRLVLGSLWSKLRLRETVLLDIRFVALALELGFFWFTFVNG